MESSSSSISELPPNQRSVNCSIAPLMTSESNRPFFIAVCTEIICELDPITISEIYDELQDYWTLIDGYGNSHEVEFNKCMLMPILTQGWHQFRDFYQITTNPLMSYTYLGNSVFQIQFFNLILPADLGNFLQVKNHEYLRLCGGSNTITICKLIFKKDPTSNSTTVIIGRGWKSFCLTNHIYPGSILEFKCDSIMAKNIVSVCKFSRRY